MSLTALAWAVIVSMLLVLSFTRAAFAVALYLTTFFMFPSFWWWGDELPEWRWNLFAGVVLLVSAVATRAFNPAKGDESPTLSILGFLMLANALVVHLLFAPVASISLESLTLFAKFVLLFVLMRMAINTPTDMRIVLWAMALGAAYIGYEVTINDRGSLSGARLEGIGAAGVANSNQLASLMVAVLPLVGALFFIGNKLEKVAAAVVAAFVLNVLILCNSRGAFLATFLAAGVFLVVSSGRMRKQAVRALALGAVAAFLLLGDPDITNRFLTIFTSAEERDTSASNRLLFWRAGIAMAADHPLGAGGFGFSKVYSGRYLRATGVDLESRAVHNGFINEICEWGLQGLALKLAFFAVALGLARRATKYQSTHGDPHQAVLGATLIAAMAAFLGTCVFGDYMDEEWGFWLVALMAAYARLWGAPLAKDAGTERPELSVLLPSSRGAGLAPPGLRA